MGKLKSTKKEKVVLLFSGGLDSLASFHILEKQNYEVIPLYIHYGQSWVVEEFLSASNLSRHFGKELSIINLNHILYSKGNFFPMRNALLLGLGLNYAYGHKIPNVAIGSSISTYSDQTPEFIDRFSFMNQMCFPWNNQFGNILAPVINWSKVRVIKYCIENNLPTLNSYSCSCGKCYTCKLRKKFNVEFDNLLFEPLFDEAFKLLDVQGSNLERA